MTLPTWAYWLCGVLGVLGLLVMYRSLFADAVSRRRHGKEPRCPKCWYAMTAAASLRCPECGHTAASPAHLLKSRRHWRKASAGLLLVVLAAAPNALMRIGLETWAHISPSWLLEAMQNGPLKGPDMQQVLWGQSSSIATRGPTDFINDELWARYAGGRLSLTQRHRLANKQFSPAMPPLMAFCERGGLGPKDITIQVTGAFSGPLPRTLECTPKFERGTKFTLYDRGTERMWQRDSPTERLIINRPPEELQELTWDVDIYEGEDVVWEGTVSWPVPSE